MPLYYRLSTSWYVFLYVEDTLIWKRGDSLTWWKWFRFTIRWDYSNGFLDASNCYGCTDKLSSDDLFCLSFKRFHQIFSFLKGGFFYFPSGFCKVVFGLMIQTMAVIQNTVHVPVYVRRSTWPSHRHERRQRNGMSRKKNTGPASKRFVVTNLRHDQKK